MVWNFLSFFSSFLSPLTTSSCPHQDGGGNALSVPRTWMKIMSCTNMKLQTLKCHTAEMVGPNHLVSEYGGGMEEGSSIMVCPGFCFILGFWERWHHGGTAKSQSVCACVCTCVALFSYLPPLLNTHTNTHTKTVNCLEHPQCHLVLWRARHYTSVCVNKEWEIKTERFNLFMP